MLRNLGLSGRQDPGGHIGHQSQRLARTPLAIDEATVTVTPDRDSDSESGPRPPGHGPGPELQHVHHHATGIMAPVAT